MKPGGNLGLVGGGVALEISPCHFLRFRAREGGGGNIRFDSQRMHFPQVPRQIW